MRERSRLIAWFSFGAAVTAIAVVAEVILGFIFGASTAALFDYDGLVTVTIYGAIAAFVGVALFDIFGERSAPAEGTPKTEAETPGPGAAPASAKEH